MLRDVASSADKAMAHLGCTNSSRNFGGFVVLDMEWFILEGILFKKEITGF
jgi:hypothetical protein